MSARQNIAVASAALVSMAAVCAADAGVVRGVVFADGDGDGRRSAGEGPIAGAWVWLGTRSRVESGADGRFELPAPRHGDIVWVRTPDGFAPGPAWRAIEAPSSGVEIDVELELGLVASASADPLTFVHVSDAHVGKSLFAGHGRIGSGDLRHALAQAIDLEPAPAFVVMTGDLTNSEKPAEIAEAASVLFDLGVPFVPVPGNHDWVARGANYRAVFGPPSYSFDSGGVHFVVLNDNWRRPPDIAFLRADLATLDDAGRDRGIVVFTHRPPEDDAVRELEQLGVDYLFTGHWHANRYLERGDLRQLNVEPIVRGGIDFTPAGYRIVTMVDGEISVVHRTVVESAQVQLVWPPASGCVAAGPTTVLAAVQVSGREPVVRVRAAGAEAFPMTAVGGWAYAADKVALEADGSIELVVTVGGREVARQQRAFAVCAASPPKVAIADWPQSQGSAEHHGHSRGAIRPPLRALWATAIGGSVYGGSPAVSGELVIVGRSDLTDGRSGGVIALDVRTGAQVWQHITGDAVRGTPAVASELVVIGSAAGRITALTLAGGEVVWSVDLADGSESNRGVFIAAPTVADGVVYAGVIGRFAAISLSSGEVLWEDRAFAPTSEDLSTRASATVFGGLVVATAGLGRDGLVAWDRATGKRRWKLGSKITNGINASPISRGDRLWVTNAAGELRAIDLAGKVEWSRALVRNGSGFSHSIPATPALGERMIVVPTQYQSLVAARAETGRIAWELAVDRGSVHSAHNARQARSVTASPVITDDVVWVASVDGWLRAADLASGELLWSTELGAPALSGPVPAGELLIVAGFDGIVRAFAHDPSMPAITATGGHRTDGSDLILAVMLLLFGFAGLAVLKGRR